ncbi:MAG: hypothetical protein AABX80_02470, partial [Nanoarchaeota archaeon]
QAIKKLAEKPEKYIKIRSSLISNVLRLKTALGIGSYAELNDFLSALAQDSDNNKKLNEAVNSTSNNLIQKSEELPSDADLSSGGD